MSFLTPFNLMFLFLLLFLYFYWYTIIIFYGIVKIILFYFMWLYIYHFYIFLNIFFSLYSVVVRECAAHYRRSCGYLLYCSFTNTTSSPQQLVTSFSAKSSSPSNSTSAVRRPSVWLPSGFNVLRPHRPVVDPQIAGRPERKPSDQGSWPHTNHSVSAESTIFSSSQWTIKTFRSSTSTTPSPQGIGPMS